MDLIGFASFMTGRNAGGPARTGASSPKTGLAVERTINSFESLFDVETDLVDCVSELPELPEHSVKTISSNANTEHFRMRDWQHHRIKT